MATKAIYMLEDGSDVYSLQGFEFHQTRYYLDTKGTNFNAHRGTRLQD